MTTQFNKLQRSFLAGGVVFGFTAALASAQESSLLVPKPAVTSVQPILPPPSQPVPRVQSRTTSSQVVIDESVPALPSQPTAGVTLDSAVTRPAPGCIKYDTDRSARKMYAKSGSVEVVMVACNPANGCSYEIPLCIPGCCTGAPTVSSRCGLFGRGIVEYCWPCGFSAEVKFRNIGDIKVDYDG